MTIHKLKTWTEYYKAIESGEKTFELRVNDRDFKLDDILILQEWNEDIGFTGKELQKKVSYILNGGVFGLEEGYVIMSLIEP